MVFRRRDFLARHQNDFMINSIDEIKDAQDAGQEKYSEAEQQVLYVQSCFQSPDRVFPTGKSPDQLTRVMLLKLTLNSDPVKKVATAVPSRIVPSAPLMKQKDSKIRCPKILLGFDRNS